MTINKDNSSASETLHQSMQGVWWLLSREDRTMDGQRRIDPVLGSDPLAILSYAKTHFAAQFMKRDRTEKKTASSFIAGKNNTGSLDGYDAYFGTYEVIDETGIVAHTLLGSVVPANIGMTVNRKIQVIDDKLIIELETTSVDGEAIIRTLTWERIS
jgi:hypothetical protein